MNTDTNPLSALAMVIPIVLAVVIYLWTSITLARVFLRLGISGWKAWVPVLNIAEIFAKAGIPAWYVVLLIVPVVNLFGIYQLATAFHRINVAFGKGAGMTALAVLLLPVWATIISLEGAAPPPSAPEEVPVSHALPPAIPAEPVAPSSAPSQPSAMPAVAAQQPAPVPAPPLPAPPVPAPSMPVTTPGASAFAPPPAAAAPPAAPVAPPVIAPPPGVAPTAPTPVDAPVDPAERGQRIVEEPAVREDPIPAVQLAAPDERAAAEPVNVATAVEFATAAESSPESPADEDEEDRTVVVEDDVLEDEEDRTVVVDRRPAVVWELVTADGERLPLTSPSVVLGRKPGPVLGSTVVAVPDVTKTLSKLHARLDLGDDVWTITDLGSTNGVLVIEPDGSEREIEASGSSIVTGSFVLGKVVLGIERVESVG